MRRLIKPRLGVDFGPQCGVAGDKGEKGAGAVILRGEILTRRVWMGEGELSPADSRRVVDHSPAGFAWGYRGAGAAQLALAIMLLIAPRDEALAHYRALEVAMIAAVDEDEDLFLDMGRVIAWYQGRKG